MKKDFKFCFEFIFEKNSKFEVKQMSNFTLVMNCRPAFPTIELSLIDFKPGFESSNEVLNFLRRMIATAANDSRILDNS